MVLPRQPETIMLAGDRRLAWYAFGDPEGRPVFYFHGFPGSGVEAAWGSAAASRAGIRLLGIDRPGFGWSDPHRGRSIDSLVDDVRVLADHLGIHRFGVLGMSGGAPFALASAALAPERVHSAAVVSGMGPLVDGRAEPGMTPFNRIGLRLAARAPWALTALAPLVAMFPRHVPGAVVSHLAAVTNEHDRVFLQGELGALLTESFRRAVRHGADGMLSEARMFVRPWGSWFGRLSLPVHLFHGGQDRIVPVTIARRMAENIPRCEARFYAEEGHFSVMGRHLEEVMAAVGRP